VGRSRLALAASVALLVGASLVVGGKTAGVRPAGPPSLALPDGSGGLPPELRRPKLKTSLEQDPAGGTAIKVDVILDDFPPPE
jgi:hypothetical protein